MTAPHLTVAIATLIDRLDSLNFDILPTAEGVDYHVFVQGITNSATVADVLPRADITVTPLNSSGVAISRNAAIASAQGDIILFADDDLILATDSYRALQAKFEDNPELDFICGQLQNASGQSFKSYPSNMARATRLNTGKVGTPEMAIRVKTVRGARVLFDKNFGAGSAKWLGDEYIFICDALRAGLRGRHVDLVFATHLTASSGQNNSAASFLVRDAVLRRALGPFSWPLRCAFAWRHRKRLPNWATLFLFLRP